MKYLKFDENMFPILTEEQAVQALLQGHVIEQKIVDPAAKEEYVAAKERIVGEFIDIFYEPRSIDYHDLAIRTWNIPEEYKTLDVYNLVKSKCTTGPELDRLDQEWALFEKHQFIDKLQVIVYIIDCFKHNQIVWGVGRGSSVASFVLYKLGLHMIDPIKYDLKITEFFKEQHD